MANLTVNSRLKVKGPLNGVKILDLTHVWAGPLAVRFLADLGADVVKVEAPMSRGPQEFPSTPIGGWLGGEPADEPFNRNAVFNKLARNRESLCLDLKQKRGREVFLELVAIADVVVENFSVRAMPALDLDYATLRAANPTIIYLAMPGFGSHGPLKDRVAFGPTVEVMSGFTSMMGYGPQEPRNTAMALMDPVTATNATAALLTALYRRQSSGEGCRIEMSLHEGGVNYCGPWLLDEQMGGRPQCQGNRHPNMSPHGIFPCSGHDEWIALACADEGQWHALCSVIEGLDEQWMLDERQRRVEDIEDKISGWTKRHEKNLATQLLQNAGIPAGPVNTVPEMTADPQTLAREFFVAYERFDTPMPGNPIHMQGLTTDDWTRCPKLGEHNEVVLREWLGYTHDQIEPLARSGVLATRPPL